MIRRRLRRRYKVKEKPKEESTIDKVVALITAITHEEDTAKTVGTLTGINLTTLAVNFYRLLKGEMSEKEVFAHFQNVAGVYFGAKEAAKAWGSIMEELQKLRFPTLEEVTSVVVSKIHEFLDWTGEKEAKERFTRRLEEDMHG